MRPCKCLENHENDYLHISYLRERFRAVEVAFLSCVPREDLSMPKELSEYGTHLALMEVQVPDGDETKVGLLFFPERLGEYAFLVGSETSIDILTDFESLKAALAS